MNNTVNTKTHKTIIKLALCGILTAVAVAGSLLQFPVLGSKCSPVQHMVNIFCAVFLGPWYGVASAFIASLLRNLFSLGSLMAFPGSMVGALLAGVTYAAAKKLKNNYVRLILTLIAEVIGTGVLGGLCAYPVSIFLMGNEAGSVAFYAYIVPFLISTVAGSAISGIIILALERAGVMSKMKKSLE